MEANGGEGFTTIITTTIVHVDDQQLLEQQLVAR